MSLTVPEASVDGAIAKARPETLHSLPHGSSEQASANAGVDRPRPRPAGVPVTGTLRAVVFVSRVDADLERAMQCLAQLGTASVRAVHLGVADATLGAEFWARYGHELEFVPHGRASVREARAVVRAEHAADPDALIAVVVAGTRNGGPSRLVQRSGERRMRAGMLSESRVLVLNP